MLFVPSPVNAVLRCLLKIHFIEQVGVVATHLACTRFESRTGQRLF